MLKDISFQIVPGQSVALVGVTGSGKTSIASVLTRLYEIQKGTIWLDDVDIRKIEKIGLRYVIGLVSQDIFLFAGTLRDNITLFNPMSDSKVLGIIEELGLMPFIDRMPGGLGMQIVERGANLSVGERQFISLSRIILYDPRVIILMRRLPAWTLFRGLDPKCRSKGNTGQDVYLHCPSFIHHPAL